jgi:hypothetical protein
MTANVHHIFCYYFLVLILEITGLLMNNFIFQGALLLVLTLDFSTIG